MYLSESHSSFEEIEKETHMFCLGALGEGREEDAGKSKACKDTTKSSFHKAELNVIGLSSL